MNDMDKAEKPRKSYFKKNNIKTCKENNHSFTITTDKCEHKHCSKCGMCQAVNGCFQIIENDEKMKNRKITLINKSKFTTKDIEEITLGLLEGQLAPSFYLICEDVFSCKGISLTNLDKPTIIIFIENLGQFAKTFVHELTHIQQHTNNYTNEEEAIQKEREVVIN